VDLRQAIPHCESIRDFVSRDLFSGILRDEEQHIDFLETQLDLIGRIGLQSWVKLNSGSAESGASS
jgi:bacterioferritin